MVRRGIWLVVRASAALAVGSALLFHTYLLDGVDRWIFSRAFVEDAEQAAGDSDAGFRACGWDCQGWNAAERI